MKTVNLNALRVFAVAARNGNLQWAARELNLSHGAVSQRIKQLEGELGVMLFERQPRGVALTAFGRTYHRAVEEALAILAKAAADVDEANCQVTLHVGSSTASKWLMPRLDGFAALHPDIILSTEVHEDVLARNLGRNEVAIWPGYSTDSSSAHHVRRLTELQLVAVGRPDLSGSNGLIDIETLISLPLLQDAHRRWERLLEATGHRSQSRLLNFGSSALALDAAINGHGVAIAPTYLVERDIRSGRLAEVWRSPDPSGEYLFLSWAKRHADETPLRQTVGWILSEFGLETAPLV